MMLLRPYTHQPNNVYKAYTTEEGIKWEKVKERERVRVREEEREIKS